jgi:Family of unknown function (DUF5681)
VGVLWVKGQSGNPRGRSPVKKLWRDALLLEVLSPTKDGRQKLRAIAEKLVQMALDGNMCAIREIANRLDGKLHLSVALSAERYEPPVKYDYEPPVKYDSATNLRMLREIAYSEGFILMPWRDDIHQDVPDEFAVDAARRFVERRARAVELSRLRPIL